MPAAVVTMGAKESWALPEALAGTGVDRDLVVYRYSPVDWYTVSSDEVLYFDGGYDRDDCEYVYCDSVYGAALYCY